MDKQQNTLPIQTYVRSRVSTSVTDIGDLSQGTVNLTLAKPSDVQITIVSDSFGGQPALFIAAIGRTPTLLDFDVVIGPVDGRYVKDQNRYTLRLPAGTAAFNWKSMEPDATPATFPTTGSRLVLAIDQ